MAKVEIIQEPMKRQDFEPIEIHVGENSFRTLSRTLMRSGLFARYINSTQESKKMIVPLEDSQDPEGKTVPLVDSSKGDQDTSRKIFLQEDGSYFIDQDPELFTLILRYLRRPVLPLYLGSFISDELDFLLALQVEADDFEVPELVTWLQEKVDKLKKLKEIMQ